MKPLKRPRETYKAPSRKIPVKETLILLVTCSFHIIGSGIIRNMISRIIFTIPVPSADALTSWHSGSLMLLSQMACTGTHSNNESRNAAMNHVMVNAPATQSVIRNHLLTPKRRWYNSRIETFTSVWAPKYTICVAIKLYRLST